MKIIFDEKLVETMEERYTVLELDTVMQPAMTSPITLHAVVDDIPLEELPQLANLKELHKQMIFHYKTGDWHLLEDAVAPLMGKWNGSLDSFYQEVLDFSAECAKLNKTWDGVRHTIPTDG